MILAAGLLGLGRWARLLLPWAGALAACCAFAAKQDPVLRWTAPTGLLPLERQVLFAMNDGETGHELWTMKLDGSGAMLLKDIRPGSAGSFPAGPTRLGDLAIFAADDGTHGNELWRSDGTADGTRLLKDIRPGSGDSTPAGFTPFK